MGAGATRPKAGSAGIRQCLLSTNQLTTTMNTTPHTMTTKTTNPKTRATKPTTPPRNFTMADCQPWAGDLGLFADTAELIDNPTQWQKMGLQQTASGFGARLNTGRSIQFEGRAYRLYCTQYSNAGSVWFKSKGRTIYVN